MQPHLLPCQSMWGLDDLGTPETWNMQASLYGLPSHNRAVILLAAANELIQIVRVVAGS
jgi:hypothetical protein